MNNEIVKMFNDSPVRIIQKNGEPWFLFKDICHILEIGNPSQAKTRLKDDGVITNEVIDSLGRKQNATFINESNLYKTIFQSRKKQAETFTDWVTEDVLPTLRKHGAYIMPGLSQEAVANIVSKIESTFNVLTHDNHVLREENEYLRQYEPKCDFGDDSEITGRAKWMIRRGAYVSGRGRKAKCLKPTGSGCIQLNLFDDYLPMKNVIESMKLLGVNEVNLSLV